MSYLCRRKGDYAITPPATPPVIVTGVDRYADRVVSIGGIPHLRVIDQAGATFKDIPLPAGGGTGSAALPIRGSILQGQTEVILITESMFVDRVEFDADGLYSLSIDINNQEWMSETEFAGPATATLSGPFVQAGQTIAIKNVTKAIKYAIFYSPFSIVSQ